MTTTGEAEAGAGLRSALWLPLFDELADASVAARLAAEAEEAGWHGFFVWDNLNWHAPVRQVADAWITLAAAATATERLRIGPMVTPLARRRPVKVARETATLDRLSGGRLTLGVGLGSDRFGAEFSATGDQVDDRQRGQMLDEALQILTAAWSGSPVHHRGQHYTVDGLQFLPRPLQRPGVPVWAAGLPGNARPLRRAARCDGFFPSEPGTPRPGRGDRRHHRRAAREPGRALRHRGRAAARQRSGPVRRGGRHVVADRIRAHGGAGPGAWRAPRRPGRIVNGQCVASGRSARGRR
jgi:alkanesulfonate monooxygenase SsuD/methylene tetrahydromethanopterin reductase-like flavin-dependent oxidoreductase (luciferase family)